MDSFERKEGLPDWRLKCGSHETWVEVFSIGEDDCWIDLLGDAVRGALLELSMTHTMFARIHLNHEDQCRRSAPPKTDELDAIIEAIWSKRGTIQDVITKCLLNVGNIVRTPNVELSDSDGQWRMTASGVSGYVMLALSPRPNIEVQYSIERNQYVSLLEDIYVNLTGNAAGRHIPDTPSEVVVSAYTNRFRVRMEQKQGQLRRHLDAPGRLVLAVSLDTPWNWSIGGFGPPALEATTADGSTLLDRLADFAESATNHLLGQRVPCVVYRSHWGHLWVGRGRALREIAQGR